MQPTQDDARQLANSTISVPCYSKKPHKYHHHQAEIKRSSSTPPPTANEREAVEEQLLRPVSCLENKEDIEAVTGEVKGL